MLRFSKCNKKITNNIWHVMFLFTHKSSKITLVPIDVILVLLNNCVIKAQSQCIYIPFISENYVEEKADNTKNDCSSVRNKDNNDQR